MEAITFADSGVMLGIGSEEIKSLLTFGKVDPVA